MCSGVITITMIIAAWAPAITTIAATSSGRSRTTVSALLHDVCETTGTSAAWRASRRRVRPQRDEQHEARGQDADGPDREGSGELGQPTAAGRSSRRAR